MSTLGSLFDGSGGFPLAGALSGITPLWASEMEPYPIAVTTSRFPQMQHLGNVTEVDGGEIPPWYNSLHTDSAEYKMWGNGIALPNAAYVLAGIADALANTVVEQV